MKGGRCEACQGDGVIRVEMHFLPDVYVPCDTCGGKRYNRETLEIRYKGKNIADVLEHDGRAGARAVRATCPTVARKLETLVDVGLGYMTLGQTATDALRRRGAAREARARARASADGAHALRARRADDGTALRRHRASCSRCSATLRDQGNTVVVIEHNLDVIKTADWVIDLGPEGGAGGGEIIAAGTPEAIAAEPRSYTGQALRTLLPAQPARRPARAK